jgi:aryl-alcohol dehydrogenase-like predicted oxidoreductase
MDKRILGRTKHESSLITLGGASIRSTTLRKSNAFIKFALETGVNHIDIAPTYGSGRAEEILGDWIKEYRTNLFLACKTQKRTKKEAATELQRSLKKLQTDYFDLYQLHGLDDLDELNLAVSEKGVLSAILEAREQDVIKYIGITSHNPLTIMRALEAFDFDTVLLPVNYVLSAHSEPLNDYEPVLSLAKKRNLGVIAMKAIAKGPWVNDERPYLTWYHPFHTQQEVNEAVQFTLSQYVTSIASSSDIHIAKMMIDAAERYIPMSEEEQQKLRLKASKYKPLFPRS